ncbi:MAG TPA: hypothetical protein VGB53_14670 [Rubricoccaceae bacterium]|jgi:hypothetical protein
MNRSSVVAASALLVALFAVLTSLFAVFRPEVASPEARGAELRAAGEANAQQLLVHMVFYQRYAEKAHTAAEAENWPLAAFYAHEIEENTERLIDGGIVDEGINLSAIAAEVALPRAQRLLAAARSGDRARFDSTYAVMLDGCNACHKRSGHRFIQIQTPAAPADYPSQSFAPIPGLRPE